MKIIDRLLGNTIKAAKSPAGYIDLTGGYRLEKGPAKVSLIFEEAETPDETMRLMVVRMIENGLGTKYLDGMRDIHGTKITAGVRLFFHQWKRPFVWKLYATIDGRFVPIGEKDLPEAEAIEWAKKVIKEQ